MGSNATSCGVIVAVQCALQDISDIGYRISDIGYIGYIGAKNSWLWYFPGGGVIQTLLLHHQCKLSLLVSPDLMEEIKVWGTI